ncbi:MAG: hypothetical protein SGILL_007029 [Bacillariaceae sp.]
MQQLLKAKVVYYKNSCFGANRTFETIPCDEFFNVNGTQPADLSVIGLMDDNLQWVFQNYFEYAINEWSYIMGHSICDTSHPVPKPDLKNATAALQLIYVGHKSWKGNEWVDAVQLMELAVDDHPGLAVWNELVLEVPTGPSEAEFANHTVQAVFYMKGNGLVMDEIAYRTARREAKRMGKPLMYIDLDRVQDSEQDLFHCESSDEQEHLLSSERNQPMFLRGIH